jgi:hypothetical protein
VHKRHSRHLDADARLLSARNAKYQYVEALVYEMPFGPVSRKAILWPSRCEELTLGPMVVLLPPVLYAWLALQPGPGF